MLTVYSAKVIGVPNNCLYPDKHTVTDADSMKAAVCHDYVCAAYKGDYRNNDNFIGSDCLPVDCDNDHSENPEDWVTPEDVKQAFPGVSFAVHYSRSHLKEKGGRAARPKFHVLFPVEYCTDAEAYSETKRQVNSVFPFFDEKALDAARFFFGTDPAEVEFYPGEMNLTEFLRQESFWESSQFGKSGTPVIPEGSRNATMSHFAGRVIKKYGDTDEAFACFMEEADKCIPPLEEQELGAIWNSARKFYAKVQKQPGYVAPEDYNRDFMFRPDDYSDLGQAKVLSDRYRGELAYTDATDFLRYDGTHWVESRQLAVGACEDFLDLQLAEALEAVEKTKKALMDTGISQDVINTGGKTLEKVIDTFNKKAYVDYCVALAYKAFVMKRRDMKYITSALLASKPMLLHDIAEFDSQEFYLNTPHGTYDLRRGITEPQPHTAEDYITKITSISPDLVGMNLWIQAVDSFFCGDKDLIEYVQQTVGLAAIGNVYQEALIIAYGSGSNGKSTFWNTIAKVLGNYSGTISADALTVGCKRNVKPEMAELKGKRLVIAAELEEGMRLNNSTVKQLCSTDDVSAEKKYKDPFKYTPTHNIVLYTNHLPKVGANDDGTWRRLIVIPFNAKITGKSDIKNYTDYLVKNAGGAVLTWIIEGAQKVIAAGYKLKQPPVVVEAIRQYRESNDWMSIFMDECCEIDPAFTQKSGEFYEEYRAYCARNGEYARSTSDFYKALSTAGFEKRKTKTGIMLYGIRLKSEFID